MAETSERYAVKQMFLWLRSKLRQDPELRGDLSPRPDSTYARPVTRLVDSLPDLAAELKKLFTKSGEPELATQIQRSSVVERCRCKDDFCSTF